MQGELVWIIGSSSEMMLFIAPCGLKELRQIFDNFIIFI